MITLGKEYLWINKRDYRYQSTNGYRTEKRATENRIKVMKIMGAFAVAKGIPGGKVEQVPLTELKEIS